MVIVCTAAGVQVRTTVYCVPQRVRRMPVPLHASPPAQSLMKTPGHMTCVSWRPNEHSGVIHSTDLQVVQQLGGERLDVVLVDERQHQVQRPPPDGHIRVLAQASHSKCLRTTFSLKL